MYRKERSILYLLELKSSTSVNKTMPHPTEKEAAKEEQPDGYHQFVEIHGPQLLNSGVPDFYWPKLYEKLSNEVKCILASNALLAWFCWLTCWPDVTYLESWIVDIYDKGLICQIKILHASSFYTGSYMVCSQPYNCINRWGPFSQIGYNSLFGI